MAGKLHVIKGGYSEQAVAMLEDLLAKAKDGELVEMVSFYRLKNDEACWAWTGCSDIARLVGAIESLRHQMVERMIRGK